MGDIRLNQLKNEFIIISLKFSNIFISEIIFNSYQFVFCIFKSFFIYN